MKEARRWRSLKEIYPKNLQVSREWEVRVHGSYTTLWNRTQLRPMMSDHPCESESNLAFLQAARGRVLVVGLGLGYILLPLLQDPAIVSIDVVELDPDIIAKVGAVLLEQDARGILRLHQGELESWPIGREGEWDTIYLDVWFQVGTEERAQAVRALELYRPLLAEGGWLDFWLSGSGSL